ncbi:hypothetical protein A2U01_0031016, partial [Trifolium medium]|nr:hypothetical protein [Trifolium medium]
HYSPGPVINDQIPPVDPFARQPPSTNILLSSGILHISGVELKLAVAWASGSGSI